MERIIESLLLLSIPALILVHLAVAPYTKVEESFHIQAVHDILSYGIPTGNVSQYLQSHYDHFSFPGAVPRTFIGAVVLAGISRPVAWLNGNVDRQVLARAILGLFNGVALLSYATAVRRAFGRSTSIWYLAFQASQFHVIYYASRTLSNMFAFGISTLAMRLLLPEPIPRETYKRRCCLSLFLLTVTGIVFRSEIALLLAAHTLFLLFTKRIGIQREIIPAGIAGLLVGLTSTILVDSFFWQQFPLWPEFAAFKFNVISGQASAWGTNPWHFYFLNAGPRLLLNPFTYLVGIPLSLIYPSTRFASLQLLIPSLVFVAVYSIQPHKEWRFIVYIIPPLTASSALGASYVWTHRTKSLIYRLLSLCMILSTIAAFSLSSFVLLPASAANYPGAHALRLLHSHAHNSSQPEISVYLGNLACQTGVTRFVQIPSSSTAVEGHFLTSSDGNSSIWKYDKTEDEHTKSSASFWRKFDYALVEPGSNDEKSLATSDSPWEDVDIVRGFAGVTVLRPNHTDDEKEHGQVEEKIIETVFGSGGLRAWKAGGGFIRRVLTRGWWVDVRMEPKIKIMRRSH